MTCLSCVRSCAGCQLSGETLVLAGSCSHPRNLLVIKRICHSGIMGARTWSGGEELTLSRRTGCPLNDGHHAVRCPQKSAWKPLQNHSGHIRDSLRCVEHLWGCIASLTVRESEFGLPDKHCWSGNRQDRREGMKLMRYISLALRRSFAAQPLSRRMSAPTTTRKPISKAFTPTRGEKSRRATRFGNLASRMPSIRI